MINKIIIEALREIKEDDNLVIEKNINLIGENALLDSFDFVNLTVLIEEKISDELDKEISLVNEKAFSKKNSPFKNIESLEIYISELIGE